MPSLEWGGVGNWAAYAQEEVRVKSIEESHIHLENFIRCNLLWLGEVHA